MELRHIRYFIAVAEEKSFTRAAERLRIAQPALSVQIRNLESEIGTKLFSRDGRLIELTQAGRVFLEHARQTLIDANKGVALARQAASGQIGHLSIGYSTSAEFRIFPIILPKFRKKWPEVHLAFHSLRTPKQVEKLYRGELDLGFVWLPVPSTEFDVQELVKEPFIAVLPAGHRLASASAISIKDLSREPLVLFPRDQGITSFHRIEQLFLTAGAEMNVAYELDVLHSLINFVAMGCGCTIVPDYVRRLRVDGIVYKPLVPPNIVETLAVIKKRGSGGVTESFYRFVVESLADFDSGASLNST